MKAATAIMAATTSNTAPQRILSVVLIELPLLLAGVLGFCKSVLDARLVVVLVGEGVMPAVGLLVGVGEPLRMVIGCCARKAPVEASVARMFACGTFKLVGR